MDPISIIVMALVTGAAAALRPTTEQAVKDAYIGIKGLIQRKYGNIDFAILEADPTSKSRQEVIKEDLEKTDARRDEELLHNAEVMLDSIQTYASDVVKTVGVNLKDIKAAALEIKNIIATGINPIGIQLEHGKFNNTIKIENVTAQSGEDTSPQKKL